MRIVENGRTKAPEDAAAEIGSRLRLRHSTICEAIIARIRDPATFGLVASEDAEYLAGLRTTVVVAVDYVLTGMERGEEWSGPVPSAAVEQAHRAARWGVSLDTIMLRYIAGHRVLGEFVKDEVDLVGYSSHGHVLHQLRRTQESLLERVMAVVANEYQQEHKRLQRSPEQGRRELVQRLLTGEYADPTILNYEFDAWHLGVIAVDARAEKAIRHLAHGLGRQLLSVVCGEGTVWAWLGGHGKLTVADIERLLSSGGISGVRLAIGDLHKGLDGWRLTHREAQAALPVALSGSQTLTRCADVPLEAALLRHDLLTRVLMENYLLPLSNQRDGGLVFRETLRAYFAKECNAAKAGVALRVDRHTVGRRLRAIEEALGRLIPACRAELEVALHLEQLDSVQEYVRDHVARGQ